MQTSRFASIFACVAISLTGCTSDTCAPADYHWATAGGGPGQGDGVTGAALASDGSVWITGTFIGGATWGSFQLTAADTVHPSIFVAKLDPSGKVVLARAIQGGSGGIANIDNVPSRIRLDASDNPVLAGTFQMALDVDTVHLVETDNGNGAAFVLGLDGATGAARFGAMSEGDTDGVAAHDLAIDASGDLYVTGGYNGTVAFGSITVDGTSSDQGVFVAKYSPATSAWVWAKGWAGMVDRTNDGGVGYGIAATADGNVYATGSISGTLKVDGTVLGADGGSFLAKLAAGTGQVAWTGQITPSDPSDRDWTSAATVDDTGALYVTGEFQKTAMFGAQAVSSTGGGNDMFLAKYDPSGAPVWVQHAGVSDGVTTRGDDVAFDGASVYVSGFTQGDTIFSTQTLAFSSNLFAAMYDPTGKLLWVQNAKNLSGGTDAAEAATLAVTSPVSGVVIAGSFTKKTGFGTIDLTDSGEGDAFVADICN